MLGFAALAEPDEPQVGDELEEARWFTLDEIRAASARGERSAAPAPGERDAASAPGEHDAASAPGERDAASAPSERDAALEDDGPLLSPSISISRWLIDQWRLAAEADAGR
jgi:NAD+ diphosphatase